MGRWAEVYFTTAPEKRSSAVAELLRELEAASSATQSDLQAPQDPEKVQTEEAERKLDTSEKALIPEPSNEAEPGAICRECGYSSPDDQKFCGMCGAPLSLFAEEQASEPSPEVPATVSDFRESRSWSESAPGATPEVDYAEPVFQHESFNAGSREHFYGTEPSPPPDNEIPHFAMEAPPVPYRYRLYIGAGLAILLAVLLYMAWRGTAALSGVRQSPPSRTIPEAPPAASAAEPPAPRNAATAPARDVIPVEAAPAPRKTNNLAPPDHKAERPPDRPLQSAKSSDMNALKKPLERPAPRMVPTAAQSSAGALEQSSAQDFATAEKYLSGTQGTSRDSREASQWLWKAVGKGNPAATIALSDLYLRGDGVPKSCDQARLLLDAAARKGAKGAGERLRNLQAFGCR